MWEFLVKYKWWIIIAIVVIIVIIVIYNRNKNKNSQTTNPQNQSQWSQTGSSASGGGGGLSSTKCQEQSVFPLKKGSVGKQVGALQKFINAVPTSNKLTVDCSFGSATESEVFRGIGKKEVDLATYKSYNIWKFES